MDGKNIRLNRLLKNGKMFCVPLDHGVTNGPVGKLSNFNKLVMDIVNNGATAIVVHKGMVRWIPMLNDTGIIVHLSASTDMYNEVKKVLVCTVEDALRLGADAVSIHVNIGNSYEKEMIKDLANVASQCEYFGIPLLAMMYVRDDLNTNSTEKKEILHAVEIASELGADIVKITHMHDVSDIKEIVDISSIPVIIAGGDRCSNEDILYKRTKIILEQGVMGISYGRNIFESTDPLKTIQNIKKLF